MRKNEIICFNDGIVNIYREKNNRSTFGAKANVNAFEDMDFIIKLDYEMLSIRQQDQEFALQNGFNVSMKIRTRYVGSVDSKCKAVIGNRLYDISYIDKTKTELYLYLEEVRTIGA